MPAESISSPPIPEEVFERYPGKWVAIREGRTVIATADTHDELVADERLEETDTLYYVPKEYTLFYGARSRLAS